MHVRMIVIAMLAVLTGLTATAADTTPPTMSIPAARPDVLSPPNGELRTVSIVIEAKDDTDPDPRCAVQKVWSDDGISQDDWKVTGDFEVALRAATSGTNDRIYNVVMICSDASGNQSGASAAVRVTAAEPKTDKPPMFVKLAASPDTLKPTGETVPVKIAVDVVDDNDPQPRCAVQSVWSDEPLREDDWKVTGQFEVALRATTTTTNDRIYNVIVLCTDSAGNQAGHSAPVRIEAPPDKTDQPPVFRRLAASPDTLAPTGEMAAVKIDVDVVDDNDPQPRCAVQQVWSDDGISQDDWKITGDFEVALRAATSRDQDRIYNVVVLCSDSAGNQAGHAATVRVTAPEPKEDRPPVLAKLAASPDVLSPADNELHSVKIEVEAVDDNDPQPRCAVRSIGSDQPITDEDWKISGELEVALRATAGRIYHVVVVCTDSAGNEAGDSARVTVEDSQSDLAPVLMSLVPSSDVLKANNEMVPVKLAVSVIDDHDPQPRCLVTNVWSNQLLGALDWSLKDNLEIALRATTTGGQDRFYSVAVTCTDFAGNTASDVATIRVTGESSSSNTTQPPPPTRRRSSRS